MLPVVAKMAERFEMQPQEFERTVRSTVCPQNITNEQFVAFLMVAKEYNLNPITKQIYAFPSKGAIVPIVSIDGWLRIINENPNFDGMEFVDNVVDGKLFSITCRMYRKDRNRPTEVTEYMGECVRGTDTWKQWPARMLRHKATIQAARYAFGLSGIYDEDEAQRMGAAKEKDMGTAEIVQETKPTELPAYQQEGFTANLPTWKKSIDDGRISADQVIARVSSKYRLSEEQKAAIRALEAKEEEPQREAIDGEFLAAYDKENGDA